MQLKPTSIACLRVRNECELQGAFNRALARLLVQLWFYFLYWPRSCLSITPGSMVAGICNIKNNSERGQSKHASRKGSCEVAQMPVQ